MSRFVKTVVVCAVCGREKGPSNHWFLLARPDNTQPLSEDNSGLYRVWGLSKVFPPKDGEFPACGEACLHKLESKIIAGETIA